MGTKDGCRAGVRRMEGVLNGTRWGGVDVPVEVRMPAHGRTSSGGCLSSTGIRAACMCTLIVETNGFAIMPAWNADKQGRVDTSDSDSSFKSAAIPGPREPPHTRHTKLGRESPSEAGS